jgi:release factor glutamine methyltransferase
VSRDLFTTRELVAQAVELLTASDSARLDAEILLSHALGRPRTFLHSHPEHMPSPQQQQEFSALLQRRSAGEPIAYLAGQQEFWSLPLRVTPATLIPRPATEVLVNTALQLGGATAQVVDLGTGSGCIALALAHERPAWNIFAVDRSAAALEIARANAQALRIETITWQVSDWFADIGGTFDLVVSNPPYIKADDPHLLQGDVRFEPRQALVGGADGLDAIRQIAQQSQDRLQPGGALLLEIGYDQAAAVRKLLTDFGYTNIDFKKDLQDIERVCIARFPTSS